MVYIVKKSGATQSVAICDKCGGGFTWQGNISITQMERIIRKKHGWKVGKYHICERCK